MKPLQIFLYEWKHFLRNPFKLVALLLFIVAALYGLHNGSNLYHQQMDEIKKIHEEIDKDKAETLAYFDKNEKGPEARPWVDVTTPFWAIWYTPGYHFKTPSAAMVYSMGQAEQYGFYKKITFMASPFDADMAEEIANPERLQTGTLDFSFVILFLLPLLLLILLYNLKSSEAEQGFLPLIEVQTASKYSWLVSRMGFYVLGTFIIILLLLTYGAILTNVFETAGSAFVQIIIYSLLYLLLWSILYFFILRSGKSVLGNSLKMIGVWLLITFVIPAIAHQTVSIKKPVNLMTDFIEVRDQQQELYQEPDSIIQKKLVDLFPQIAKSSVLKDSLKTNFAKSRSYYALINELKKKSIQPVITESKEKNNMIQATYWFNPLSFFQNKLNRITKTHYKDYAEYRDEIQEMVDVRIEFLIDGLWNDVKVDKATYLNYYENFNQEK